MTQVFPRWFDTLARAGILCIVLMIPATTGGLALFYHSDYVTGTNTAYEQPVPFSHAHHTGQLGIDCRYCHDTSETSAFAGMPSTETCMNCHQQIWVGAEVLAPIRESWKSGEPLRWQRVHNLPGFVYFHHGAHVSKGVGCVECHGHVDQMPLTYQEKPLTMGWCLDCHRNPATHLRPRSEVYNMTWSAKEVIDPKSGSTVGTDELAAWLRNDYRIADTQKLTSCSTCHR